jgi:flagellar protein FlgJ
MIASTDIILEVTRAADPSRSAKALQKLSAAQGDFADLLERQATVSAGRSDPAGSIPGSSQLAYGPGGVKSRIPDPFSRLEAFFLQTVIQHMMPSGHGSVFGSGPGADAWRSMMAEQIANQIASSGGIGLASQLSASTERHVSGGPAQEALAKTSQEGKTL